MVQMTIQEVQQVSLEILKDVHEFCVENNIRYSLAYGTLLGAIRHNGFIPWDDDIDIMMPRPDYERFIHSYKSRKGYKLFARGAEGGNHVYRCIARVCEMEKTYVDPTDSPWVNEKTGIFIDILPIDGAPNTQKEALRHIKQRKLWLKLSYTYRKKHVPFRLIFKMRPEMMVKTLVKKGLSLFVSNQCIDKMIAHQKKFDYDECEYICANTTYGIGEWMPKRKVERYELHRFEDSEFYVFAEYDYVLKNYYHNYMEIPPVEERTVHIANRYYWTD